jgi:hypothetical protein
VLEARGLLRSAGTELDGLGGTAERKATESLTACDDLMDAIVAAEQLDRELDRIEEASS